MPCEKRGRNTDEGRTTCSNCFFSPRARWRLRAAVQNGANAVYLGYDMFNARMGAQNFSADELQEAIVYCHVRGVQVHLTLNTLVSDREIARAAEVIRRRPCSEWMRSSCRTWYGAAVQGDCAVDSDSCVDADVDSLA